MKSWVKFTLLAHIVCQGLSILTVSAQNLKPTPAADRIKGIANRKLLDNNSVVKTVPFRNIGPVQMNGRVVDIEVNPEDPTEFYVAYASGGLWHTQNNGLSFLPLFDNEDVMSIGDIAVNWKNGIIWVGTGEANSSRSSYSGIGLYKSADKGKTWQHIGLPESHHIGEIILHPNNADIAWVAVMGHLYSANKERGVYKTIDGGANWKQILYINENTGAAEMDINPTNPNELMACMWYRTRRAWDFVGAGTTSGIYKSTDGGDSWTLITTPGSGFPTGDKIGRIGVAYAPSSPSIVYAVVDNQQVKPDTSRKKMDTSKYSIESVKNLTVASFLELDNKKLDTFLKKRGFPEEHTAASVKEQVKKGLLSPNVLYDWLVADDGFQNSGIYGCEIYKSTDGGKSWTKTNQKSIGVFSTYGYYFGKIFVAPTDADQVITFGTSIIVSTDGGKTFDEADKNNTHGDWHACWINPRRKSHWIAGNDGGINITYDAGKKWFMAASVPAGQFYAITTDDAKPYRVYGGLQDNGVWYGPSAVGNGSYGISFADEPKEATPEDYEWKPIGGGDGMQVQVDRRDNSTVYAGYQFGYYYRTQTTASENGRKDDLDIHPMHNLGEPKLRYNWQTPILLSQHNQDILYYGASKFFRSLNKGEKMQALTGDLTNGKKQGAVPYGTITTISESPLRFGLIYIGTDDGNVAISKDGGYQFQSVSNGLPAQYWVSRVQASRFKEGRVYVTLNGYRADDFSALLYISNDYGQSWTKLGNDLPAEPLNAIKEDNRNADIIYVGSDNGLYVSFTMGQSFMGFGKALPRVAIHDIAIHDRDNELILGTHGRSIFIARLDTVHQLYQKWLHSQQLKSALKTFSPSSLNDGDVAIDCPPAKPTKRKKAKSKQEALVKIE
jgi:photosystem II stability/assembly factor-like uncharacterized protein